VTTLIQRALGPDKKAAEMSASDDANQADESRTGGQQVPGDRARQRRWVPGAAALLTGRTAAHPASSEAATYTRPATWALDMPGSVAAPAQFWHRGPRYVGPRFIGPRRGFVYSRPWVRRPYYGTIVGGVVLGAGDAVLLDDELDSEEEPFLVEL